MHLQPSPRKMDRGRPVLTPSVLTGTADNGAPRMMRFAVRNVRFWSNSGVGGRRVALPPLGVVRRLLPSHVVWFSLVPGAS
jgi:hypothetical protein